MTSLDSGIRCDQHVGEAFPPRCAACQAPNTEEMWPGLQVCPTHPMSLQPCKRCDKANREGNDE